MMLQSRGDLASYREVFFSGKRECRNFYKQAYDIFLRHLFFSHARAHFLSYSRKAPFAWSPDRTDRLSATSSWLWDRQPTISRPPWTTGNLLSPESHTRTQTSSLNANICILDADSFTFLLSFTSVNMEWTRHVFENMEPKANEKPAISSHALAVQMYGNAATLDNCESSPRKITLL